MTQSENLPLTPLRFIAAALVVLQHYAPAVPMLPPALTGLGMPAVSFFFVLSGFILTWCYRDDGRDNAMKVDDRAFFVARFARIAPIYWLSLLVAAPLYLNSYWSTHEIDARTFATGAVLVPLMMQAWVTPAALLWNAPAWSLSVECFFYAVFPATIRIARRIGPIALLIASVAMMYALKLAFARRGHFLHLPMSADTKMKFMAYFPLFRLPQFTTGIAIALLFERRQKPRPGRHAAIALAAAALLLSTGKTGVLSHYLASTAAFAALIYGVAGLQGTAAKVLNARVPVLLGEASYATYLLHWPLAIFWLNTGLREKIAHISPWLDFASYIALVLGALATDLVGARRNNARIHAAKLGLGRRDL